MKMGDMLLLDSYKVHVVCAGTQSQSCQEMQPALGQLQFCSAMYVIPLMLKLQCHFGF